jgi:hypothetical protein
MNALKQKIKGKIFKYRGLLLHVDIEQRMAYIITAHKRNAV